MEFRRRRLIAVTALVAAVVVAIIVAALAAWALYDPDAGEAGHTGTDAHEHIEPGSDAAGAAQEAMTAIFTWRPAGQEGPWDSMHATEHLFTGRLADAAAQRPDPEPLPKQWLAWAEENARIAGATEVTDTYVDADTGQVRVVVKQRVMHSDGDVTPLPDMTALVDVIDTADGWKAENYQLEAMN